MKNKFIFLLLFLLPTVIFAQNITGVWQGILSRSNPNCDLYPESFPLSYFLEQNGNMVTGSIEVFVGNTPYFAQYQLNGGNLINTNFLYAGDLFQDVPPPGFFWCDDNIGDLEYIEAEDVLQGTSVSLSGNICCDADVYVSRLGIISDNIFCRGETVELEVSGQDVKWYSDNMTTDLIGTGNTIEATINGPTSFFITQSFLQGESDPYRFEVDIYDRQITDFELNITNACFDDGGAIEILLANDIEALYKIDDGIFSIDTIFNGLSAGNYSLTIQDENGCEIDTSFQVIDEPCRIEFLSDIIYCNGTSVELEVTGEDIRWYADNNLNDLLGVGNTLEFAINGPTSFFVTQTFLGEESDPFRFEVAIFEEKINDFELLITNACNDNFGQVEVLLENNVDALFRIDNMDFSSNNTIEGLSAADYTLTIQDENGCQTDSIFQIINEECRIGIPNAFSPDGDGLNDDFGVEVLYDFGATINLFKVFNRWGEKVIELQNQNIEAAVWDGTNGGKLLASDVYLYIIEVKYASGRTESFKGDVTLIR